MNDSTAPRGRDGPFAHDHLTAVSAQEAWRGLDLRELWAYRELVRALVSRDISVRYRQTVLGAVWAVMQPVLTMAVFTLVFGRLAGLPSDGQPYALFVYAALLPWMLFSSGVAACGQSVVAAAGLVSKVYFPRVIVPLASIGTALVDFLIAVVVLVPLAAFLGGAPGPGVLLAPLLVSGVLALTLGVGLVLAALNVTYRDFRYVVPFMLQIWLFLTPVVYPLSLVPERWQWLAMFNPMTGYVTGLRAAVLGGAMPWGPVAASLLLTAVILAAGVAWFQRAERRFADLI